MKFKIKKILRFLSGPEVKDLRTNNPCRMAREGLPCPYINVCMPCEQCQEYTKKEQE